MKSHSPNAIGGLLAALILSALPPAGAQVPNTLHHTLLSPNTTPQAVAQYGQAVASDGNLLVVGAPFTDDSVQDSGQAFVYDATTGALLFTLKNPTPVAGDEFGYSVAVSGRRVVVGAHKDTASPASGAACVFDLDSATPTVPVVTLNNPLAFGGQRNFGRAVAISGTRVMIGAYGVNSSDGGAAYLYDISSATPTVALLTFARENNGDGFGNSVAIEGTRVVIGAHLNNTGGADAGSAYVYDINGATPIVPVLTLRNPAPAATDFFGFSVALSGNRIAVGTPLDDAGGADSGIGYIFDITSATPTVPVHTLSHPTPATLDAFGITVAFSGAKLLVGASLDDVGANPDAGTAFLFDLAGATPTVPILTIVNPTPTVSGAGDNFGFAVALTGTNALIGAYFDDVPGVGTNIGIAYLYDTAGATPDVPALTLRSAALKGGDLFGSAVAVSGSHAVVCAKNATSTDNGSVYVYHTATAALVTTLTPPIITGSFGGSAAISGNRIVAGGYHHSSPGTGNNAGRAYVFDLSTATPDVPAFSLNNPAPNSLDLFGFAVAISGTRVVVGAHQDDDGAPNSGIAYVFDVASATPNTPIAILPNPTPLADDNFGIAVGIDGTRIAVAAPGDDTGFPDAGSVYYFDLTSATPTVPVRTLNNPTAADQDRFGAALAISGSRILVGAHQDDTTGANSGTVYAYDMTSASPTVPYATLANPNPTAEDFYGFSVALSGGTAVIGASQDDAGGTDSGAIYVYDISGATPTAVLVTLTNPSPGTGDKFGTAVAVSGVNGLFGAPNDDDHVFNKGAAYLYGLERPEITVEQPVLSNIPDGGGRSFGTVRTGSSVSLNFLLKNTGTSELSGISLTKNGTHAAEFTVTTPPPSAVPPGGSASVIIRFNPVTSGSKTAAIHLASNDFDENPFDFDLTGASLANNEDTDGDGMNDWAEFQLAPQGFDYRLAQPALVGQFYAGANEAGLFTTSQVQSMHIEAELATRNPVTGEFLITIGLEKSTNLVNYLPFPMSEPQTTINPQGRLELRFTVPDNAAFFRLEKD